MHGFEILDTRDLTRIIELRSVSLSVGSNGRQMGGQCSMSFEMFHEIGQRNNADDRYAELSRNLLHGR